jgi:hypothetical protein
VSKGKHFCLQYYGEGLRIVGINLFGISINLFICLNVVNFWS